MKTQIFSLRFRSGNTVFVQYVLIYEVAMQALTGPLLLTLVSVVYPAMLKKRNNKKNKTRDGTFYFLFQPRPFFVSSSAIVRKGKEEDKKKETGWFSFQYVAIRSRCPQGKRGKTARKIGRCQNGYARMVCHTTQIKKSWIKFFSLKELGIIPYFSVIVFFFRLN